MKHFKRYINKVYRKLCKKELINRKLLNKIIEKSTICQHAIRELNLSGYHANDNGPNGWIYNQVLESVAIFAYHRNNGFSAPYEINMVKTLCDLDILTPLTFNDDEFSKKISYKSSRQNLRHSTIFKETDGSIHYLEAFNIRPVNTYRYDIKEWDVNNSNITYSGGFWVSYNGLLTGEYINKCYINPERYPKGYKPEPTITINCNKIEIAEDNWLMTVDVYNDKFIELREKYNVKILFAPALKGIKDINVTPQLEELAYKQLKEYNN